MIHLAKQGTASHHNNVRIYEKSETNHIVHTRKSDNLTAVFNPKYTFTTYIFIAQSAAGTAPF